MSLKEYKKKRKFNKTPEPKGKKKESNKSLIFVVQKHDASQLHYDFRLEAGGVLKSWAVPKGPSLNPKQKRLAMMTEDHPLDYADFEGEIPEGEYGAGKVIVWDTGTYHAVDTEDKKKTEKVVKKGLKEGDFSFVLDGKKLKGEFALVKMKGRGKNAWLLIKKKDKHVSKKDITKKISSAISRKRLAG